MTRPIKLGDKVFIPTSKNAGGSFDLFLDALNKLQVKFETTYDYLLVGFQHSDNVELVTPDAHRISVGFFKESDIIMYGEEKKEVGALRYNEGKLRWDLVDFQSLEPMVTVLEFGADKYTVRNADGSIKSSGANNWKKGLKIMSIFSSLLRHVFALMRGEDNDPDSGLSHIGHLQCNAMFLAFMFKNRPDLDDRKE